MPGTEQEWDALANSRYARRVPRFDLEDSSSYGGTLVDALRITEKDYSLVADEVNKPEHYNTGKVECIEAIKASMSAEEYKGYLKGNTLKYLWRYNYKGKPKQDLEKAQWYLARLIEEQ